MAELPSPVMEIARTLVRDWRSGTNEQLTSGVLREMVVRAALAVGVQLEEAVLSAAVRELEIIFTTWIDNPMSLWDSGTKHVPWLQQKMANINWFYWDRYQRFLVEQGWAEATVQKLGDITQGTLANLEDPARDGVWDTRGMVVGHVQSGKTANYIGLICRAIDAGYKVVVVLAGIHNSLRSQTQIRLDEGLLGFDSVHNLDRGRRTPIGVGTIVPGNPVDTITTRMEAGDFRQSVARQFNISPGGHPLLFVVKKNGGVLRNLVEWVEWAAGERRAEDGHPLVPNAPLLVIDDEADYGSVDTRRQLRGADGRLDEDHDPTVLNRRIRRLLHCFEKRAYVGYTATPFANIYIHHQNELPECGADLFPRDFITLLPAPSNYVGPVRVFGIRADPDAGIVEDAEGLPVVRLVNDTLGWMRPGHKATHLPRYEGEDALPPSLRQAIRAFILACAARRARGEMTSHNSMLIHVSRYVNVQAQVQNQVQCELSGLKRRLQYGDGSRSPSLLDELRRQWEEDVMPTTAAIEDPCCPLMGWDDIQPHLLAAALAIADVRQVNGSAGDILDYIEYRRSGLSVIAIGGDKLSRGLTLEGLTVSYFLRTSRMYDTLMQMGRWFGYRPGYLDMCRLYTTGELRDWLRDITFANEELRQEFAHMVDVRGRPSDYGLKVRTHPDLLVTAPVKMRQGTELQISFAGAICETIMFHMDADTVTQNYEAARELMARLTSAGHGPSTPQQHRPNGVSLWNGLCWRDASAAEVCRFLREYRTPVEARKVQSDRLADYIEKQARGPRDELDRWTVYLAAGGGSPYSWPGSNRSVELVERRWLEGYDPDKHGLQPLYRIRRLLSPADESVDIERAAWDKAMEYTAAAWQRSTRPDKKPAPPEIPSGWALRQLRPPTNGLLLLYPLDPDASKSALGSTGEGGWPIVGFGVSFPGNPNDEKIAYVVNPVFQDQEYGELE